MNNDFNFLVSLWKNYNNASELLVNAMGGTSNEVGEFAERLVAKYYDAEQLIASNKSADLKTKNNKLIQVKSRKIEFLTTTSLNVIRSWDFDLLVVILFSKNGSILKALEITSEKAKNISKWNDHQNGYVLTTSKELLENEFSKDITQDLQQLLLGHYKVVANVTKTFNPISKNQDHKNVQKPGEHIRNEFIKIVNANKINESLLEQLQREIYCRDKFGLSYPFLLNIGSPKDKDMAFVNGYRRYGDKPYRINDKFYLITNDLYLRNVDKFDEWFKTL